MNGAVVENEQVPSLLQLGPARVAVAKGGRLG